MMKIEPFDGRRSGIESVEVRHTSIGSLTQDSYLKLENLRHVNEAINRHDEGKLTSSVNTINIFSFV